MNQVVGLPDHQGLTSVILCRVPSVSAVDLQICGDEIELISFRRTDNEWIPDALLSQRGGKHRLIVVQVVPVQSVLAGGEIDLLAIRISLACKVSKEIVGVVRIRNFRRSRLNGDGDFFCFSHILHGHRSGHSHNRIFLRPGNRTCGSGVIALVFHSFYVDDL